MPKAWFHPLAEKELVEAAQYYDVESPGLGARFLDAAESCVAAIMERPKAGRMEPGDIRRRLVRSFPYAILYREERNGVRLLAVMNLKRRPGYWVGRE